MADYYKGCPDCDWSTGCDTCANMGFVLLPPSVLVIEDGIEAAVERMLDERWRQHLKRAGVSTFSGVFAAEWQERERANVTRLLAAAVGEEGTCPPSSSR